jgi:hypothetical protein
METTIGARTGAGTALCPQMNNMISCELHLVSRKAQSSDGAAFAALLE